MKPAMAAIDSCRDCAFRMVSRKSLADSVPLAGREGMTGGGAGLRLTCIAFRSSESLNFLGVEIFLLVLTTGVETTPASSEPEYCDTSEAMKESTELVVVSFLFSLGTIEG